LNSQQRVFIDQAMIALTSILVLKCTFRRSFGKTAPQSDNDLALLATSLKFTATNQTASLLTHRTEILGLGAVECLIEASLAFLDVEGSYEGRQGLVLVIVDKTLACKRRLAMDISVWTLTRVCGRQLLELVTYKENLSRRDLYHLPQPFFGCAAHPEKAEVDQDPRTRGSFPDRCGG
jgi:hypothetical protein